jgi:hypothetical protein
MHAQLVIGLLMGVAIGFAAAAILSGLDARDSAPAPAAAMGRQEAQFPPNAIAIDPYLLIRSRQAANPDWRPPEETRFAAR